MLSVREPTKDQRPSSCFVRAPGPQSCLGSLSGASGSTDAVYLIFGLPPTQRDENASALFAIARSSFESTFDAGVIAGHPANVVEHPLVKRERLVPRMIRCLRRLRADLVGCFNDDADPKIRGSR